MRVTVGGPYVSHRHAVGRAQYARDRTCHTLLSPSRRLERERAGRHGCVDPPFGRILISMDPYAGTATGRTESDSSAFPRVSGRKQNTRIAATR